MLISFTRLTTIQHVFSWETIELWYCIACLHVTRQCCYPVAPQTRLTKSTNTERLLLPFKSNPTIRIRPRPKAVAAAATTTLLRPIVLPSKITPWVAVQGGGASRDPLGQTVPALFLAATLQQPSSLAPRREIERVPVYTSHNPAVHFSISYDEKIIRAPFVHENERSAMMLGTRSSFT
jgi:hypothetical protein